MNRTLVDPIANAVLYEGYILYPYRPSVKNRQRWTFGGLYPADYCRIPDSGDSFSQQTECLVHGSPATKVEAVVRFLHLTDRKVGEIDPPRHGPGNEGELPFKEVASLRVGDTLFQAWQEAEECEVSTGEASLDDLRSKPLLRSYHAAGGRRLEPLRGPEPGSVVGVLVREKQALDWNVELTAAQVEESLFRLTINVSNGTSLNDGQAIDRDQALLRSLVSTHVILGAHGGEFVSLIDPPECWREAAASCRNVGAWPVLVGAPGKADMMLSAPIILYDYPKVAAESPGDFFDGTEIDEILALRIMTLTDDEKSAMVAVDERARALLARTESMARDQMSKLHGTFRDVISSHGKEDSHV